MADRGQVRQSEAQPTVTLGQDKIALTPAAHHTVAASVPARIVCVRGGSRWLVTMVARILSEDVASGSESSRLILRFESMTHPKRSERIVTVRARDLADLDEKTLSSLVAARLHGSATSRSRNTAPRSRG